MWKQCNRILLLLLVSSWYSLGAEQNFSPEPDTHIFFTNFETSMGKNDPYMYHFYEKLQNALSSPKDSFFLYLKPYSGKDLLELSRATYEQNKPLPRISPLRIPLILHQIWIGNKPIPERYKAWQQTWQHVPGWEYRVWTDEEVEKLDFPHKERYRAEKNIGAKTDILRIEILYQFGGVYVDMDFECLQPHYFAILNRSYDFYCGLTPLDEETLVINNALIGSIKKHPILEAYRSSIAFKPSTETTFEVVNRGPGLLTKMILLHANRGHRDIIFPPTFFYPLGINEGEDMWDPSVPFEESCIYIKESVCRPESLAIHWWEGSWISPSCSCMYCRFKSMVSPLFTTISQKIKNVFWK